MTEPITVLRIFTSPLSLQGALVPQLQREATIQSASAARSVLCVGDHADPLCHCGLGGGNLRQCSRGGGGVSANTVRFCRAVNGTGGVDGVNSRGLRQIKSSIVCHLCGDKC